MNKSLEDKVRELVRRLDALERAFSVAVNKKQYRDAKRISEERCGVAFRLYRIFKKEKMHEQAGFYYNFMQDFYEKSFKLSEPMNKMDEEELGNKKALDTLDKEFADAAGEKNLTKIKELNDRRYEIAFDLYRHYISTDTTQAKIYYQKLQEYDLIWTENINLIYKKNTREEA